MNFDLQSHWSLRETVYRKLKSQIIRGKIAPGTRMMEMDLADKMGVSRTPIREAIQRLEKEGLVTAEPRKGAYASYIAVKDLKDLLEVREELEGFAASLAALRISDKQLEGLTRISEEYSEAIESGETEKIIHYDEMFHEYIVDCTGNKTLIELSKTINELVLRFRYLFYNDFSRYKNMPAEHRQITCAIKSRDSLWAREAADAHIKHLREFVTREGGESSQLEEGK